MVLLLDFLQLVLAKVEEGKAMFFVSYLVREISTKKKSTVIFRNSFALRPFSTTSLFCQF